MPVVSSRLGMASFLLGAGFVLTACGSDSAAEKSSVASQTSPASASAAATSGAGSAGSATATSGSGLTGSCTDPDAKYCDDFSDKSSGWPTQNTQAGYTQYDPYLGGTYRIGLRGEGTVVQPSPVRLGAVSPTYSVQVDAEVTPGPSATAATAAGFRCWSGRTSGGLPTGFGLIVDGSQVQVTVASSLSGESTVIKTAPFTGLKAGRTNRISVQCVQVNGANGVEARLAMRVNGTDAIAATYGQGTRNVSWQATDQLALVGGGGAGADVFFDNVAVSPVDV